MRKITGVIPKIYLYGQKYLTHGGQTPNFKSYIMFFPQEDITLILLSNTSGDLWSMNIALSQVIFSQSNPWGNQPEVNVEEAVLNQYTGTYSLMIEVSFLYIWKEVTF